jgi:hypothetical protein
MPLATGAACRRDETSASATPPLIPAALKAVRLGLAWQRTQFAVLDVPGLRSLWNRARLREALLDAAIPTGFTRWLDIDAKWVATWPATSPPTGEPHRR